MRQSGSAQSLNIFTVNNSANATLSGLAISNGDYGILSEGGTTTVIDCTLSGNRTGIVNATTLKVTNSTLSGNEFGLGNIGTATLTNCTVSSNTSDGISNGLGNVGTLTATNCTISGNGNRGIANSNTATVKNSIVAGNTTNTAGTITNGGNNILTGTAAAAGLDPLGLQNNGGPTKTIALQSGSPATDAGNNAFIPAGITTDQRGSGHPRIIGSSVDIGAFESAPPQVGPNFVVTNTEDNDHGFCSTTDCSLREAINAANSNANASIITFASGVTGTINLQSALPALSTDIDIQGPSANVLDVHRDTGGNYSIFVVNSGKTVSLSGLTISNGHGNNGGGIANAGTLTVKSCALSGNTGDNVGGGISSSGTLTVESCTINNNLGVFGGGGIYNSGTFVGNDTYILGTARSGTAPSAAIRPRPTLAEPEAASATILVAR